MKNRGGMGVKCQNITEKTGALAGIAAVSDDDDLMLITNSGTIIRTPAAGVSLLSRSAGGVIVMRLGEGQNIVNFTKVAKAEEKEDEAEGEVVEGAEGASEAPTEVILVTEADTNGEG
jgi:DNA gyrase subunit A